MLFAYFPPVKEKSKFSYSGIVNERKRSFMNKKVVTVMMIFIIFTSLSGCISKAKDILSISDDDTKNDESFMIFINIEDNIINIRKEQDINNWYNYSFSFVDNLTKYELYFYNGNNISAFYTNENLDLSYNTSYRIIIIEKLTGKIFKDQKITVLESMTISYSNTSGKYHISYD